MKNSVQYPSACCPDRVQPSGKNDSLVQLHAYLNSEECIMSLWKPIFTNENHSVSRLDKDHGSVAECITLFIEVQTCDLKSCMMSSI